jgi:hypothetical protein
MQHVKRAAAAIAIGGLSACSGSGMSSSTVPPRPIVASSAPANTSSQTRATFTIHWTSTSGGSIKRRDTISASTQSVSVSVNGGPVTVVNKPVLTASPVATSVSIPAPAGNDSFAFTAWDEVNGTGNILDQATTSQDILANENNTLSVVLDGVCAALVPSLATTSIYAETTTASTQLASGTRTILQAARLVGNTTQSFAFTPVDADGNTILTGGGTAPITVTESGPTHHVTIVPNATGATNTIFKVTPLVAEPDNFSTQLTASSPNCGSGTTALPNSFALSTSAAIYVADYYKGIYAFDQDGTQIAQLSTSQAITALAYNSKSNYLVALTGSSSNGLFAFQTLSPTGSVLGSGTFTPDGYEANNSTTPPYRTNPLPYNAAYNPLNGFFAVGITSGTTSSDNNVDGNVDLVSISGSTATTEGGFSGLVLPQALAVLPNGDVAVADEGGNNNVDLFTQSGSLINAVSLEPNFAAAIAFDSLRGNVLASYAIYNSSSTSYSYYGATFTVASIPPISLTRTFETPNNMQQPSTAAYNPGNDELYFFYDDGLQGLVTGFSGSAVYSGATSMSNLPNGAFASLTTPGSATVVP